MTPCGSQLRLPRERGDPINRRRCRSNCLAPWPIVGVGRMKRNASSADQATPMGWRIALARYAPYVAAHGPLDAIPVGASLLANQVFPSTSAWKENMAIASKLAPTGPLSTGASLRTQGKTCRSGPCPRHRRRRHFAGMAHSCRTARRKLVTCAATPRPARNPPAGCRASRGRRRPPARTGVRPCRHRSSASPGRPPAAALPTAARRC
ncbi:hypothetical protein SAMN05216193_114103 [Pseudomonas jinjuensis]|uniref:Uncharacterized protein n=1 Tax=Pseudomonas jinjuensis TaxID=198616 RepID=A0A1H0LKM0_9PSED|nr:hypothetical protein SAMN05216193_114103 [Pseudomonas jinjuensis]